LSSREQFWEYLSSSVKKTVSPCFCVKFDFDIMFLFSRLIHHISCFSVRRKSWAPPKAPISSYLGSGRTHLWPTVYALVQLQQCHRLGAKSKLQPALPSGFRLSSELWILGSGFWVPSPDFHTLFSEHKAARI